MQDLIGYDEIIENSMRSVIYETLKRVEKTGLPGGHYFIVTFLTKFKGIKINKSLLEYKKRLIEINTMFQYYPVPGGYYTSSNREGMQALEYYENQEYKFHHDTANDPSLKEYHRKISVVLYLNDEFDGGGTEFPNQIYKPSPGYGLFFPSNWCFPHSGQKVLSGKKRVIVTWYYVFENMS